MGLQVKGLAVTFQQITCSLHSLGLRRNTVKPVLETTCINPLPDDKILDRSKLKQSADDNSKFDENSLTNKVRNKERNE